MSTSAKSTPAKRDDRQVTSTSDVVAANAVSLYPQHSPNTSEIEPRATPEVSAGDSIVRLTEAILEGSEEM